MCTLSELFAQSVKNQWKAPFRCADSGGLCSPFFFFCNFPKLTNRQPRPLFALTGQVHVGEKGRSLHSYFFPPSPLTAESHGSRPGYGEVLHCQNGVGGEEGSLNQQGNTLCSSVHTAAIHNSSGNANTCATCNVMCFRRSVSALWSACHRDNQELCSPWRGKLLRTLQATCFWRGGGHVIWLFVKELITQHDSTKTSELIFHHNNLY